MATVADLVLDILAAHGVRDIFGIPGDAINDFTNAIRQRDDMEFILVKHEEAGAFMASAQAKLTGRMAACMGTSGPGAIHLLNGLYDAKMDHAPVIAITGQASTEYVGTEYHQEVDLEKLFADVAEYTRTVMTEEQLPAVMLEACKAALAGPGVGHVAVPNNVAGRKLHETRSLYDLGSHPGQSRPCAPSLQKAVDIIDASEKVAILAGIGCADAREELLTLSARLKAPIVRSLRAKDVLDEDVEPCIGGIGMLGGTPGVEAMENCDCLIIAGSDFPYIEFFPEDAKIVQIEISPLRMGRRARVDAPLHGHCKHTLGDLIERVQEKSDEHFYKAMQKEKAKWLKDQDKAMRSDTRPIRPQRVMAELNAIAPDDTIYLADTGTSTAWTARHLVIRENQRYTLSGALASMAFAMPGAIGAKFAYPDRPVCAITGDGAFAMLMADFQTAIHYDKPFVCVVLNNSKLAFIMLEQEAKGLPQHSIEMTNTDFVAFAKACGGDGVRVERAADLQSALKRAFASGTPFLVDVVVDPDELVMPPKITAGQAWKFGLAKAREVLG